ncbi:energy transducer TonB [Parvibium lacunae]|uniref:Energy transducer TonB n=1 Tax=Parvibium lacunae TaxID=1888893 RepID=A0A368L4E4_9BURK|nr:energy transducer TonB [Parvibium lacunae]RCS58353.1 energy transducer TonB [Parvibium lacunae]
MPIKQPASPWLRGGQLLVVVLLHGGLLIHLDQWLHLARQAAPPPLQVVLLQNEPARLAPYSALTAPATLPPAIAQQSPPPLRSNASATPTQRPANAPSMPVTPSTPAQAQGAESAAPASPVSSPMNSPISNATAPSNSAPALSANSNAAIAPPVPSGVASNAPAAAKAGGASQGVVCLQGERPIYPALAIRNEQEGRVVLTVTVGSDGKVQPALTKVHASSGYASLDRAALNSINGGNWLFSPAWRDGEAVSAVVLIPFPFVLNEEGQERPTQVGGASCKRMLNRG